MIDQDLRTQCAGLGLDPELLIPPEVAKDRPDDYEVLPDAWPAWKTFSASRTQWRIATSGMGKVHYLGLDYTSVEVVMRRVAKVPAKEQDEVFSLVQLMEHTAKQILNSK